MMSHVPLMCAVPDSLPGISISVEEPTEGSTAVSCPRCVGGYDVCIYVHTHNVFSCSHGSFVCRYEWYQTNSTVVVAFYTRFKVSLPSCCSHLSWSTSNLPQLTVHRD